MNVPAVREPEPELCPPRALLESYARGGRDPRIAGHIASCDRCAWIVTEVMEANPLPSDVGVIDITPFPGFWQRVLTRLRQLF